MTPSTRTPAALLALLVGLAAAPAAPAAFWDGPEADLTNFYRRLEDLGLSTTYLRKVEKKIKVYYWSGNSEQEARYSLSGKIFIPGSFRVKGSKTRIRYDLDAPAISTMIHEFSHAGYRRMKGKKAARGTTARKHHDAVRSIWADLYIDKRHHNLIGLPVYPEAKADEICGYFIGDAIAEVASLADEILFINTRKVRLAGSTPEELEALGDTLVIPEGTRDGYVERVRKTEFGKVDAGNEAAAFEDKDIPWRERSTTKADMYENVLGLNPPADSQELLKTLNTLDNAWIRGVRAKVLAARKAHAAKLRAAQAQAAAEAGAQAALLAGSGGAAGGLFGMD